MDPEWWYDDLNIYIAFYDSGSGSVADVQLDFEKPQRHLQNYFCPSIYPHPGYIRVFSLVNCLDLQVFSMFQIFFYSDRFHPFSSGGVTNGALPKWRCHGTAAEGVEFPTEFSSMLSDWVMVSNMVILLYNIIGATVNPAFVPWFCRSKQGYNIMASVACKT